MEYLSLWTYSRQRYGSKESQSEASGPVYILIDRVCVLTYMLSARMLVFLNLKT